MALLYPGCTVSEIALAADRLTQGGVRVRWWTPNGESVVDTAGLTVSPSPDTGPDPISACVDANIVLVPGGDPESTIADTVAEHATR